MCRNSPRFGLPDVKPPIHFTSTSNQAQDHWDLRSKNGFLLRISNNCFILIDGHPLAIVLINWFLKEFIIPENTGGNVYMEQISSYFEPLLMSF